MPRISRFLLSLLNWHSHGVFGIPFFSEHVAVSDMEAVAIDLDIAAYDQIFRRKDLVVPIGIFVLITLEEFTLINSCYYITINLSFERAVRKSGDCHR
jgi:hypothetical protein